MSADTSRLRDGDLLVEDGITWLIKDTAGMRVLINLEEIQKPPNREPFTGNLAGLFNAVPHPSTETLFPSYPTHLKEN